MRLSLSHRRTGDVPCTVTLLHDNDPLAAHVDLDGVRVGAGDRVPAHRAPVAVGFGEDAVCRRRAAGVRGSRLDRPRHRMNSMERARQGGGIAGRLRLGALSEAAAPTFLHRHALPVQRNAVPDRVRPAPAW